MLPMSLPAENFSFPTPTRSELFYLPPLTQFTTNLSLVPFIVHSKTDFISFFPNAN
jgi:hypothetical protein